MRSMTPAALACLALWTTLPANAACPSRVLMTTVRSPALPPAPARPHCSWEQGGSAQAPARPLGPRRTARLYTFVEEHAVTEYRNVPSPVVVTTIKDPWRADVRGFRLGESVRWEAQERSNPADLTLLSAGFGGARRMLADALRFCPLPGLARTNNAWPSGMDRWVHDQEAGRFVSNGPEQIDVHQPLRVRVEGTPVRVYLNARGNYETPGGGQSITKTGFYTRVETSSYSGLKQRHHAPWVQAENLFATPAFVGERGEGVALLRGIAAFPNGARVRITNLALEHTTRARTIQLVVSKRTGSSRGALLPAPTAGSEYRMVVDFPGDKDSSRTVQRTYRFRLPLAEDADDAREARPIVMLEEGAAEELPATRPNRENVDPKLWDTLP